NPGRVDARREQLYRSRGKHGRNDQERNGLMSAPQFGSIRWEKYSPQEMRNVVVSADPAAMFKQAAAAKKVAVEMGDVVIFAHAVAQDIVGAWSGNSADAAAKTISDFLQWADNTANTASHIARLLDEYSHVVNRARLEMPYPTEDG